MDNETLRKMSEDLFVQAAQNCGWPSALSGDFLHRLYTEYCRLLEREAIEEDRTERPGDLWVPDDEDTDGEEEEITGFTAWDFKETSDKLQDGEEWKDAVQTQDPKTADATAELRSRGAELLNDELQEIADEAKRILKEMLPVITKMKADQAQNFRELQTSLEQIAAFDKRQTQDTAQKYLAELEEIAYSAMIENKSLFGMLSGSQQKLRELAKESWALAGEAQVDLDIAALPPEDPRHYVDVTVPLVQQMLQHAGEHNHKSSGRLQKLVRFDDLQAELGSQKSGHKTVT